MRPLVLALATLAACAHPGLRLTILHNNDGESQLLDAGAGREAYGGISRFSALVARERARSATAADALIVVSSGDNILPGPELSAGLEGGRPLFDALALSAIGYDAICIGNHDFDLGPELLAELIERIPGPRFLAANLDFSAEPRLAALAAAGRVATSAELVVNGHRIGVVGVVTPSLPQISAPRRVAVSSAVAESVDREVSRLEAAGVKVIVLLSHLQDIKEDEALAARLRGVDAMIVGGGDELLTTPATRLLPGDEAHVAGAYPRMVRDREGREVPMVTTTGAYRYLGRLELELDGEGRLLRVGPESGPLLVDGEARDPSLERALVTPLRDALAARADAVLAESEVELDGLRTTVRARESNLGNLVADSLLWHARRLAEGAGVPAPEVAVMNGGGIRNDSLLPKGRLTELTAIDVLPFPNFLSVVPEVPAARLVAILEHSVASLGGGGFLQVAGLSVVYEDRPPLRVRELVLDDGRALVRDGLVLPDAPSVSLATISFLAGGGGGAPFAGLPFTNVGASAREAFTLYLRDGLGGRVHAERYGREPRRIRVVAAPPPGVKPAAPGFEGR